MTAAVSFQRPIAFTMGDPAGIGPEILCKALGAPRDTGHAAPVFVVGDVAVMRRAAQVIGGLPIARIETAQDAVRCPPRCVAVLEPPGLPKDLQELAWGRVDARNGAAAGTCIEYAARLALDGEVSAIVTAPIHKEALSAAGLPYPGHTEMLQALAANGQSCLPPVRMMLANEELRTVLVTIHMALRRAIDELSFEGVLETIRIADAAARRWLPEPPRIAVAGLNPHAGEGGLFGTEEIEIIAPAIEQARREGIDARGPFAPDTVFMRARHAPGHPGQFDLVIAMTHDHGLIPVKYLGVEEGVNVTLGLPFVRTSPDHGTAFDIAGTGSASEASVKAAWRMAEALAGPPR